MAGKDRPCSWSTEEAVPRHSQDTECGKTVAVGPSGYPLVCWQVGKFATWMQLGRFVQRLMVKIRALWLRHSG